MWVYAGGWIEFFVCNNQGIFDYEFKANTTKCEKSGEKFWNDLPKHVKTGIERGRKQAAEGKLTPHDRVMKKYAKYL
jgi:hypothetical protein